tara:strand:- start:106 stop:369 length:264 start_codon:yes stop_codon:yes gene_type:complete
MQDEGTSDTLHPDISEFIRFCLSRRGPKWPGLYDEMCLVACRRLFKGMSYPDLNKLGLSLALSNLERTITMVETVIARQGSQGPPTG